MSKRKSKCVLDRLFGSDSEESTNDDDTLEEQRVDNFERIAYKKMGEEKKEAGATSPLAGEVTHTVTHSCSEGVCDEQDEVWSEAQNPTARATLLDISVQKFSPSRQSHVHKQEQEEESGGQCQNTETITVIGGIKKKARSNNEEHPGIITIAQTAPTSSSASASASSVIAAYRGRRDPFCGWVTQPEGVDAVSFADSNRPSSWANCRVAFIYIHHRPALRAGRHHVGKWLWFVDRSQVDDSFVRVACALECGLLGEAVKVPPPEDAAAASPGQGSGGGERGSVLIVYTTDYRDEQDVLRVGLALRGLGATRTLSYKPDVFTLSQQRAPLPGSIFQLLAGEEVLTRSGGGAALTKALELSDKKKHGLFY